MSKKMGSFLLFLFFSLLGSQAIIAGEGHAHNDGHSHAKSSKMHSGNAVQTMASIMINLNHYPNANEKELLKKIVKTTDSRHEKIIAEAMINLRHKASSSDKAKLDMVMNDGSANKNIRELAGIVYNLSHQPSGSDKKMLSAMIE